MKHLSDKELIKKLVALHEQEHKILEAAGKHQDVDDKGKKAAGTILAKMKAKGK